MMIKPFMLVAIAVLTLSIPVFGQNDDGQQIMDLLERQAVAWNDGDIETFMKTYWSSQELQFLSSGGLTEGWQQTLDRYTTRYPDKQSMGELSFEVINLTKRTERIYTMVGQYHLDRREMDNLSGYFLLVWQKFDNDWKIIADSTH